jgi:alkanesulfonate monooxygenase SsuD/methylene tetrahydromethanopterin reductase-like flavin-dependent oxidoreductase (luciferase family)
LRAGPFDVGTAGQPAAEWVRPGNGFLRYTMICEQSRPDQLVRDVQLAEQAGFDFSVCSDHFQPWLGRVHQLGRARAAPCAAGAVTLISTERGTAAS